VTHVLILEDVNILAFLNKEYPKTEKLTKIEASSITKLENIKEDCGKINKIVLYFNGLPEQSILSVT
jgi:hypothetical protein